jgi:hypothetical protein
MQQCQWGAVNEDVAAKQQIGLGKDDYHALRVVKRLEPPGGFRSAPRVGLVLRINQSSPERDVPIGQFVTAITLFCSGPCDQRASQE